MGEWVQIINPGTGGIAEVHRGSLPQWYACGWRLLAGDEIPQPVPEPEPPPVTREQAAQAAEQASAPEPEEM